MNSFNDLGQNGGDDKPMIVRPPRTDAEFEQYFDLRWRVLRDPWSQLRGSERDQFDADAATAEHALVVDENGQVLAVGRLHFNTPDEAQIRFMAVRGSVRGQGWGRQIVEYLEAKARERDAKRVVLNARDTVAGFYEKLGYRVVAEGPVMFGTVRHVRMEKSL